MAADHDESAQTEVERLTQALVKIESETQHQHCYGCGSCIAHNALYGHFPSKRCCWGLMALREVSHSGRPGKGPG